MMQDGAKTLTVSQHSGDVKTVFFVEKMVSSVVARPSAILDQAAWVERSLGRNSFPFIRNVNFLDSSFCPSTIRAALKKDFPANFYGRFYVTRALIIYYSTKLIIDNTIENIKSV